MTIKLVKTEWEGNGIPIYTNGVITHALQVYEEWEIPTKNVQDNPETPWKWKNIEDTIPSVVLDADGNVVE